MKRGQEKRGSMREYLLQEMKYERRKEGRRREEEGEVCHACDTVSLK
jgi:hypothetical protein